MNGKQAGTQKYISLFIVLLTCLAISGCSALQTARVEGPQPQETSSQPLHSAKSPPADEVLYNTGLMYIRPENQKKDYSKAIAAFSRLIREYPESSLKEQAKTWLQVLRESENAKSVAAAVTRENEKLKRAAASLHQENDKLKRAAASLGQENEKLKQTIEESKKVDLEIEEKKRESVR